MEKETVLKRLPYHTATQTSCDFSQMEVMLQLLRQDFWLSQVEDRTSQNLHSFENFIALLVSVAIMSLLTAGEKGRVNNYTTARQPATEFQKMLCNFK